jgi:hypothetical protein
LVTFGVNSCVCPAIRLTLAGATVTVMGGLSVTVAVSTVVLSAWLLAVTVTVAEAAMVVGAV